MSKLTELLNELCPGGVEYVAAGEIAQIGTGRSDRKDAIEGGEFPFFVRSETVMRHSEYEYDETAIVIPGEGGVGEIFHYVSGKYALHQRAYRVSFTTDAIDTRFAFYHFQANFKRFIERVAVTATVKSIRKPMLTKFPIPVPPLEVQQEIVRVLDAFTDLEQSLVSELELRKKQLNDYRHAHFANIKETDGCAVTLGEIAEVRSGWGFPKAYQGTLSGDLPFFKVGDMNLPGNETFLHSANNYISDTQAQELKVKPAPTGSIVFPKVGAAIATNKKRILAQESAFDNNVMSLVPGQKVDSDFLFHWIQTEDLVRWGNSSGGVPSIRKSDVEKVTLILLPREQQEVVASRLNVFSNLIQSIEQEISLRRQQYEFYRDELLSFAPKED